MTRKEQLAFCKRCTNRKMDMQQGLICSLSGEGANFSGECPDFNLDPTVKVKSNNTEPLERQELKSNVSADVYERLRMEQNFPMAIIAGIFTGIFGAILWGTITVATNFQIGYMAIAIGAGVGFSMRYTGKGIDQIFGITGGMVAVLSCVLGNFLSVIGFTANSEGLGYTETLLSFNYAYFVPLLLETFSIIDLFFYGIAGYEGYKFAFRVLSERDLSALNR